MQKRHIDLLTTRLEQAIDAGCAYVSWKEIYRWYEVKKIAANTYRDIIERWEEVSAGKFGSLQQIPTNDGTYLIASGRVQTFGKEDAKN